MAEELSFVLINPYTIAKSRTGGVIARYIGRTDLHFVAARMFGPSRELVEQYADNVRRGDPDNPEMSNLIADYILRNYAPDPVTGRVRRVMLLLFEGEDAIRKIWEVTGSASLKPGSGETIRDTYGDFLVDENKKVQYFEPAVLVPPSRKKAAATLRLWSRFADTDGGIVESAVDVPSGNGVEKTLVLLKPDNFRFPSFRPGTIIDLLSTSGLRIIGVKKFRMTVAQAEEFYWPVREVLREKFKDIAGSRVAAAIAHELGCDLPEPTMVEMNDRLAPLFARSQFENIIKYMTGYKPSECSEAEKGVLAREGCVALVYDGIDAVRKIRTILGSTDPSKAKPGSVRREFGSDIMMNAAHASDSEENAVREMRIIKVEENMITPMVEKHYGAQ